MPTHTCYSISLKSVFEIPAILEENPIIFQLLSLGERAKIMWLTLVFQTKCRISTANAKLHVCTMYEFKVFKDKLRNNQEKTQFIARLLAQGPTKIAISWRGGD